MYFSQTWALLNLTHGQQTLWEDPKLYANLPTVWNCEKVPQLCYDQSTVPALTTSPPRSGLPTPGSSLGPQESLTNQHMSFMRFCPHSCTLGKDFPHFVLTHAHLGKTSRSVAHRSEPNTLNLEVLSRWASGKSCNLLVWVSISILLSLEPGCHIHHLRRSTSSSINPNVLSWPHPLVQRHRMCHVVWPLRTHTSHAHHACATTTAMRRVGSDTICNDPPSRGQVRLRLIAL
jgi:hypothetical protein